MKTKEELIQLKEEYERLNKELAELNEEELEQVTGGITLDGEGEKKGYNVGIFPGLSGFP